MRRDVQEIFRNTPHEKQVMMFSATLSKEIRPVCKKFMQDVITEAFVLFLLRYICTTTLVFYLGVSHIPWVGSASCWGPYQPVSWPPPVTWRSKISVLAKSLSYSSITHKELYWNHYHTPPNHQLPLILKPYISYSYKSEPVIQLTLMLPVSFKLSFELDSTQSRAHLESCLLAHPHLYPYCIHPMGAISPVPHCCFSLVLSFCVHALLCAYTCSHRRSSGGLFPVWHTPSSHRGKWCKCESNSIPEHPNLTWSILYPPYIALTFPILLSSTCITSQLQECRSWPSRHQSKNIPSRWRS